MSEFTQGSVTVHMPDELTLPEKAGRLSVTEVRRLPKARKNVIFVCEAVAAAMRKNPDRLCPHGVTADDLETSGRMVELMNSLVTDLETTMRVISQSDLLLGAEAHEMLRKVLAFVRSQETFDPRLTDLVPDLIDYFSRKPSHQVESESAPAASTLPVPSSAAA